MNARSTPPARPASVEALEPRQLLSGTAFNDDAQPWAIASVGPTRIEAENFDAGGAGVGFNEVDTVETDWSTYRADSPGVDVTGAAPGGRDNAPKLDRSSTGGPSRGTRSRASTFPCPA